MLCRDRRQCHGWLFSPSPPRTIQQGILFACSVHGTSLVLSFCRGEAALVTPAGSSRGQGAEPLCKSRGSQLGTQLARLCAKQLDQSHGEQESRAQSWGHLFLFLFYTHRLHCSVSGGDKPQQTSRTLLSWRFQLHLLFPFLLDAVTPYCNVIGSFHLASPVPEQ